MINKNRRTEKQRTANSTYQ